MNNEFLKNEIKTIIESIDDMSVQIDQHDGKIPQIEIDLLMQEVRKLYDELLKLDRVNRDYKPGDQKPLTHTTPGSAETTEKHQSDKTKQTGSTDLFSDHSGTVADKYKKESPTVSEKISIENREESIGDKYQKNIIPDLKSAIGINDKFAFINELFEGDMQEYKVAIDKLNEFDNREQALDYLDLISKEKEWKEGNEQVDQLKKYILRRYPEEK